MQAEKQIKTKQIQVLKKRHELSIHFFSIQKKKNIRKGQKYILSCIMHTK